MEVIKVVTKWPAAIHAHGDSLKISREEPEKDGFNSRWIDWHKYSKSRKAKALPWNQSGP